MSPPSSRARSPVLNLQLGRLNLDLLGLTVDLAPVSLIINAVGAPGALLVSRPLALCPLSSLPIPSSSTPHASVNL